MKVRIEDLAFDYEDFRLEVGPLVFPGAQVTSIVGPNGAGKSTFLKCLASVLPVPARSIFIDGRDLAALRGRERARLVAYVPQEPSFIFNYAVLDFVLTGRAAFLPAFGVPSAHDVALAEEALRYVGLERRLRRPFLELSSGERRLVLIARALAQGSDVLLLDEPTSFLDPRHEVETMALCRRLADERGKTVIVTLHNLEMAVRTSDVMVFMKNGRVVASGPPRRTLSEPLLRDVYDLDMRIVECGGQVFFTK
jgi:iron complex transport system ATP-binding protein